MKFPLCWVNAELHSYYAEPTRSQILLRWGNSEWTKHCTSGPVCEKIEKNEYTSLRALYVYKIYVWLMKKHACVVCTVHCLPSCHVSMFFVKIFKSENLHRPADVFFCINFFIYFLFPFNIYFRFVYYSGILVQKSSTATLKSAWLNMAQPQLWTVHDLIRRNCNFKQCVT